MEGSYTRTTPTKQRRQLIQYALGLIKTYREAEAPEGSSSGFGGVAKWCGLQVILSSVVGLWREHHPSRSRDANVSVAALTAVLLFL